MLVVDYIIIGIILISILVGLVRGFFREALSLGTWLIAIWAAWQFSPVVEPWLGEAFSAESVRIWVSRFILFAIILILGGLITSLVATVVSKTGLTGTDRTLGMVFGLFRGVLLFGLLVIFGDIMKLSQESWWDDSALMPAGIGIAGWMTDMLESGVDYVDISELPGGEENR